MKPLLLAYLISAATPVAAEISFDWPVDCTLGEDCYIQNYMDRDPGPAYRDFTCGSLSYDGHNGTDIALPTRADIARGVAVRAAAAGIVQAVRDGMPDRLFENQDLDGRDCGNGVVIDHGEGWVSQYCHLRQGSISVAPGQRLEAGAPLGEIGLSGRTEFAHLHLAIRRNGTPVDVFAPDAGEACVTPDADTLWADPVAYAPGGLLDVGFTTTVPNYDDVKAGTATTALTSEGNLVLFGFAFGARQGDVWRFDITGPQGQVITHAAVIERSRAQLFRAIGKKAQPDPWPRGSYRGTISMERDGIVIDRISTITRID